MREKVILWIAMAHLCLLMMVMGGAIFETFVNFPNWFRDVPGSLEAARAFFVVRNPGHFFQLLVPLAIITALVLVVAAWRYRFPRNLLLASLALMVLAEVGTLMRMYPLIRVLLQEGTSQHSVEQLRATGQLFLQLNSLRMAALVVAAFGLSLPAVTSLVRARVSS
jgi:hypothetical protein